MAPKVNKKQPKTKGQVEKKLQDKAAQALERERKHVQQTKASRQEAMQQELMAWFESHPSAFEYIHRGCFLGTFDNLDNPGVSNTDPGSGVKLPPYQNKFKLLAKEWDFPGSHKQFILMMSKTQYSCVSIRNPSPGRSGQWTSWTASSPVSRHS